MFYSEILASLNFNKNKMLSPGLENNIIIYVKIVGKIPDKHLDLWLFSNPGDRVQNR